MEQVKLFFKRVSKKMYFCLFAIFFIATYPWYKKLNTKWTMYRIMKYSGRTYREKIQRIF